MKLYDPDCANSYVWNMIAKNHKAGTATSYLLTQTPSPKAYEERGYVLVNPVQMGRYDEEGCYHTYKPPVDGCFPGKYARVPLGKDYKKEYERQKIYDRYPAKDGKELQV
tara:strand:+ start:579 stop:908 length:330 start_codon:yes stop_codon:yes gene_type:complete